MPRATRYYNWLIVRTDCKKYELLKAAYPNWERGYHDERLVNSDELIIYAELIDTLNYVEQIGWLGFEINKPKQEVEIFLNPTGKHNSIFTGVGYSVTKRGILIKKQWEIESLRQLLQRKLGVYRSDLLKSWVDTGVEFTQLQPYQQELETTIEKQIGGSLDPLHLILNSS
jgi:hypothetical protein